tara:strand:+ start:5127 stop:6014 length:888 start_codon:yes stop_codon:yes gene_type:complete
MYIDLSKLTDGFSSKFRVISFFLAIIIINKLERKLYLYEKKTKDAPYLFTDFCLIKNFKIIKLKKKPNTKIKFTPYNYTEELKKLKKIYAIDHKKNLNFNSLSQKLYKNFYPNRKIKEKIRKINLPSNFIGLHIRTTDRSLNVNNFISKIQFREMIFDFQIKHMTNNVINFLDKKFTKVNIFICSDSKFYRQKILEKFKGKSNIFTNNTSFKPQNFRQTNGLDFLTELFCLSKSKLIISTLGGAVPESASLISKKKIRIYKWTNRINIFIFFKILILLIFYLKKTKTKLLNNFKF